jgi:enterobactin synthetase component D
MDDAGNREHIERSGGARQFEAARLDVRDNGFIREVERLVFPTLTPGIGALRCRFDASAFYEELYAELGIACPESLFRALRKRKAEYLAGRYLCRLLLRERGLPTLIPSGRHREPLWPVGWIGSVTHTDEIAVSCIAPCASVNILGIDVERWLDGDTAASLAPIIIGRDKYTRLAGPWSYGHAVTLAFSAKESLFKALYPQVGSYFDFNCAELIDANHAAGTFSLRIAKQLSGRIPAGRIYEGYFKDWGSCVATIVAGGAGRAD